MGRIVSEVKISTLSGEKSLIVSALVDTGATYLSVPLNILEQIGLQKFQETPVRLADGKWQSLPLYGPALVDVIGFGRACVCVLALPEGAESLLGYTLLEQIPVGVDILGHRLLKVEADLKGEGGRMNHPGDKTGGRTS